MHTFSLHSLLNIMKPIHFSLLNKNHIYLYFSTHALLLVALFKRYGYKTFHCWNPVIQYTPSFTRALFLSLMSLSCSLPSHSSPPPYSRAGKLLFFLSFSPSNFFWTLWFTLLLMEGSLDCQFLHFQHQFLIQNDQKQLSLS